MIEIATASASRRTPPLVVLGTALAVVLAACQSQRDQAFAAYLEGREANRTITMEPFGEIGDPIADPAFDFLLTNLSAARVALPDDFGARIFAYAEARGMWSEIENRVTYSPRGVPKILEPVSEPPFNQKVVDVWAPGDLKWASHLRVMVSGNLLGDDGELGEEVVAYVEIELRH